MPPDRAGRAPHAERPAITDELTGTAVVIPLFAEVRMGGRIILAHEQPFAIGPVTVRPATRTVSCAGVETVIEPRVMQVLVALAQAGSAVVSRDDLVERCWEGRIVGDDAINRVLSRLRRLSEDVGGGAFAIETITRIGYRLKQSGAIPDAVPPAGAVKPGVAPRASPASRLTRRSAIALGVGGIALAAGGGTWLALRPPALPPAALAALDRGLTAIREGTPDQTTAAIAAFREAVELAPQSARPWGFLALAYQRQLVQSGAADANTAALAEVRTRDAAAHALALDSDNADAALALIGLVPIFRHWLSAEAACGALLARHPDHGGAHAFYGSILGQVGRGREALAHFERALDADPLAPTRHTSVVFGLWTEGRLDEADAAMAKAVAIWPRHFSVWFTRLRMLTYTGRGGAALAMLADTDNRPIGIPDWNFAMSEAEARAVMTRLPADIDAASRILFDAAHRASGFAENAIVFHVVTGRIDDAFRLIDAYFFDRGFAVGAARYSKEQGMYQRRRERLSYFLTIPNTAALRADTRFARVVSEIGLTDYWQRSGTKPDYRSA